MTLPGLNPKTQNEIVEQELQLTTNEITETIKLPGISTLHMKPTEEIALVLTNLLKSRSNIKSITYVIGSHIELTCVNNGFNSTR
jgi:hypothetical protein